MIALPQRKIAVRRLLKPWHSDFTNPAPKIFHCLPRQHQHHNADHGHEQRVPLHVLPRSFFTDRSAHACSGLPSL